MTIVVISIWFAIVIGFGGWFLTRGVIELRSGTAKIMGWPRFERASRPIQYWIAITGRAIGVLAAVLLIALFFFWRR